MAPAVHIDLLQRIITIDLTMLAAQPTAQMLIVLLIIQS